MSKLDLMGEFLLNVRIKFVLPYIKGRVLDIGCGTNKLVRLYEDGVGVDIFQFGDADLIVENTSKLPFPDKSFGTVTILAALNHIPNRHEVLKEAHRVLTDDGRIIITMIPPGLSAIWHLLRSPWDRDQKERGKKENEVFGISQKNVRAILLKAGFRIVEEKSFMLKINRMYISVKDCNA